MRTKADLLRAINADIAEDVDWAAGARRYVDTMFEKHGKAYIEAYSDGKPLSRLPKCDPGPMLTENVSYLRNFVETVALLKLPGEAHILDVACGGGWFSHWLARMNYSVFGFDISADFVELAKRRISSDPLTEATPEALDRAFFVCDIETERLPIDLRDTFDAAIFESCLHHFVDPISALTHIAEGLNDGGLAVIIEGENRSGAIKDEFMQVMRDLDTLERPYKREHLIEALSMAGLAEVEFLAPVPGWMSLNDPLHPHLTEHHRNIANSINLCLAGKTREALRRVLPWRG